MSIFNNKYPYTDLHELNLDWVIGEVKRLAEEWAQTKTEWTTTRDAWTELYNYVHDYFDNLDVQEEVNNKIQSMISSGEFSAIINPYIDNLIAEKFAEIDETLATQNENIDVLTARMSTFTHLAEGSTTGDAELIDIRVAANGSVYASAGDSVRGQITGLNDALGKYSNPQLLPPFTENSYGDGGVAIHIYPNHTVSLSGTSLSFININFYYEASQIPSYIGKGVKYVTGISNQNENIKLRVYYFKAGSSNPIRLLDITNSTGNFILPADAVGFIFRVELYPNITYNETFGLTGINTDFSIEEDIADKVGFSELPNRLLSLIPNKKILTLIDDDSTNGIIDIRRMCNELDIKCTFGYLPGLTTEANKERLSEYQNEGFDIANHSYSHDRWYGSTSSATMFTIDECENDLIKAIRDIKAHNFIDGDKHFIYPGSSAGRSGIPEMISKWCDCGVAGGNNGINLNYANGRYLINRIFIDPSQHSTADYYTGILSSLLDTDNPWVVFGTHSGMGSAHFNYEMTKSILQFAINTGWEIRTLSDALKFRNKFYNIKETFNLQ